jgi:hypothetical protein
MAYSCLTEDCNLGDCPNCHAVAALREQVAAPRYQVDAYYVYDRRKSDPPATLVRAGRCTVELSLQDDGKTLVVFLTDRPLTL